MRQSTLDRSVRIIFLHYYWLLLYFIVRVVSCECPSLSSCSYILCFRSRMCGRCTRSVAGTSSLLGTVSENNMKINFPSRQVLHTCRGKMKTIWAHLLLVLIIPDKNPQQSDSVRIRKRQRLAAWTLLETVRPSSVIVQTCPPRKMLFICKGNLRQFFLKCWHFKVHCSLFNLILYP